MLSHFSCVYLWPCGLIIHQAPLSIGYSRQEYWSGLPFPSPGDLLNPGTEPSSSSLEDRFFTTDTLSHVRLFATPWTAGFPVLHYLLEDAQTHVHWVDDAIQPLHPLSSPSLPVFNLSQQQGFFPWVSSLHQVARFLELQHYSFQWIFRVDFL